MKKVGRNDPCPCGSGKKFKKCCEKKMIGKRFMATKIEKDDTENKTSGLTSFFQQTISTDESQATSKKLQEIKKEPKDEEEIKEKEEEIIEEEDKSSDDDTEKS